MQLASEDHEVEVVAGGLTEVHPLEDVVEDDWAFVIDQLLGVLYHDSDFYSSFLYFFVELLEADISLDDQIFLQVFFDGSADVADELYDEGIF